jgi:hypothetical protein
MADRQSSGESRLNCSRAAVNFERITLGARLALPPFQVNVIWPECIPVHCDPQATEVSMAPASLTSVVPIAKFFAVVRGRGLSKLKVPRVAPSSLSERVCYAQLSITRTKRGGSRGSALSGKWTTTVRVNRYLFRERSFSSCKPLNHNVPPPVYAWTASAARRAATGRCLPARYLRRVL